MEFRVLGPLEVRGDSGPINVGGPKPQTVLAVLLAHANRRVSADRLIDEVWGSNPPDAARKALQSYVAQLRRAVNRSTELLQGDGTGYLIEVTPEQLDSLLFEVTLRDVSRDRDRPADEVANALRGGLELWRGSPYELLRDDVPSLAQEAARLEELRMTAIERRIEADITSGATTGLAAELEGLVGAHPYRERLWFLYMTVLYRAGRQADALAAYSRLRMTLAEELGLDPSPELQRLELRILDHDLGDEPGESIASTEQTVISRRNPYKGLRAFDEGDAADFHGRQGLVRRMLERLESRSTSGRLVVVAGPSGSGKSSVVRAGLVPAIRRGEAGSQRWRVVDVYPGSDPFSRLAAAFAHDVAFAADIGNRAAGVRSSSVKPAEPTLVIIDQFEELFSLVGDLAVRDRYLDWICDVAEGRVGGLRAVVTMRSDFIDDALRHARLGQILEPSLVLVPPLQERDVRDAVVEPARSVGVRVQPDLVATIVADVGSRPTALPLLQFALTELFDARSGDNLTVEVYRASGGLLGALARRAEETYLDAPAPQRDAMRQVLLRLATIADDEQFLRRRTQRTELEGVGTSAAIVDDAVERLVANRLAVVDVDPVTGAATIEIAHEALLAEWPRLARWLDDARDDIAQQRTLARAAAEWDAAGRDDDYVLTGTRLDRVAEWADSSTVQLAELENAYLETGLQRDARMRARRKRLRRTAVGALAAALLTMSLLAIYAFLQRGTALEQRSVAEAETTRAEREAERAETEARIADARRLAAAAIAEIATQPELALFDALEAVHVTRSHDGSVLRDAEQALHLALQSIRTEISAEDGGGAAAFSSDGSRIAIGGTTEAHVLDAATGETVLTLEGHTAPVFNAAFDPTGEYLATNSIDGTTRIWSARDGDPVAVLEAAGAPIGVEFSLDGRWLATSHADDRVRVWDVAGWQEHSALPNAGPLGVNWTPDGRIVVAAGPGVRLWGIDGLTPDLTLRDPTGEGFTDVAVSPDGLRAAAGGSDGSVVVFDLVTGRQVDRLFGHSGSVEAIAFSSEGQLATGSTDGTIRLWDLDLGRQVLDLSGQGSAIVNIDFSPDARRLASGSANGAARIWDVTPARSREWFTIDGHPEVIDADYGPDGAILATAGFDGTARLWDAETGSLLATLEGHTAPVRRVDVGPGSLVATASFDGTARVWDARSGDQLWSFATEGAVGGVRLGDDGTTLAVAVAMAGPCEAGAGVVKIWDLTDGGLVLDRQVHSDFPATDVALAPDGQWFVTAGCGVLRSFDTGTGTLRWEQEAHVSAFNPAILQIDVSPDGALIASGGWDGTVTVRDSSTGELRRTFTAHTGEVWAVEFSPDGERLASASHDGSVRVWNVQGGFEMLTLMSHESAVDDVAFDADGRRLATTSIREGLVRVHALDIDDLIRLAETEAEKFEGFVRLD